MPLNSGGIIAIVGLDSSGKTVVVERLARWLQQQVEVQQMHYGYARGTLLTSALRGALAVRRFRTTADTGEQVPPDASPSGLFAHIRFLALAYERRRLLARAVQAASRGSVVIVERWYSLVPGKMDSPRLDLSAGTALKRLMARQEQRLYASSPDPDLIVHLQVDEAVAIERNRARTAAIDDTDEQIRHRFRWHSDLPYRCDEQAAIDNNGEIEQTMLRIRQRVAPLLRRTDADQQ